MALLRNKDIRPFVPASLKMDKQTLRTMLNDHKMVYVKPIFGTMGLGVMRVEKISAATNEKYRCQLGFQPRTFRQYDQLYRTIEKIKMKRPYMVQKGIHLLKYKKRPFDIRVMV